MSKSGQAYVDSASERAESAQSDLAFASHLMRETAAKLEALRTHLLDRRSLVTLDAIDCLEELASDLRLAAGKPDEATDHAATATAVADAIELEF